MKKILITLCLVLTIVTLFGCAEVVSEKPIDTRYTAAYDAMETVYSYKYDWWHGDWRLLPEMKMVHHDEIYEVQYEIAYSNGNTRNEWRTVNKAEYEAALSEVAK